MKTKNTSRKLLSILICCAMLVGLLPTIVFAAEPLTQTIKFPITKTVIQGGDVAPGLQTFDFEIFNIGNSNSEEYADVSVSSSVRTNGAGDYQTTLEITGYEEQLNAMTCEGFYVREKNTGADNWTYSDQVYSVEPVYKDGMIVRFEIYPVELTGSGDGLYYERTQEEPLNRMTFENTYTENNPSTSGDPLESSFPSDSTDTTEPTESTGSSNTTEPTESTGSSDSTESSNPIGSNDPTTPSDSTDLDEPSDSDELIDTNETTVINESTGNKGDINAPQTGDDRNIFVLLAIICVSGLGILGTTVYGKKKRES